MMHSQNSRLKIKETSSNLIWMEIKTQLVGRSLILVVLLPNFVHSIRIVNCVLVLRRLKALKWLQNLYSVQKIHKYRTITQLKFQWLISSDKTVMKFKPIEVIRLMKSLKRSNQLPFHSGQSVYTRRNLIKKVLQKFAFKRFPFSKDLKMNFRN